MSVSLGKKLTYICIFDSQIRKGNKRGYPLSSEQVIMSKARLLADSGYHIDIVSMSPTIEKGVDIGGEYPIEKNINLKLFCSIGHTNTIFKLLDFIVLRVQLMIYLLSKRSSDTVIVYHSLAYMGLIKLSRVLRNYRLILEIQEIYGDVIRKPECSKKEMNFANQADAYIFPTLLLNKKVNIYNKPFVVAPGSYNVEKIMVNSQDKHKDNLIHCVYAGTLDPRKGCLDAISAAKYLPPRYCIHVIGFGSKEQIETVNYAIRIVNQVGNAKVTFDGKLTGNRYIKFLQSCSIGLSTQAPDAAFNATSFPSKILSYLSNGLRVVSIRIPAIEESSVGKLLYFYDKQDAKGIADGIMSIQFNNDYDSRDEIKKLSKKLQHDLVSIVEGKW